MTDKIVSIYGDNVEDNLRQVIVMVKRVSDAIEKAIMDVNVISERVTRLEDKLLEMKLKEEGK